MGVLSSIKDKIFGKGKTETATPAATPVSATPTAKAAALTGKPSPALAGKAAALLGGMPAAAPVPEVKPEPVDVEAIVEALVKAKGVPSNWRVSIVDLLKALDLDSSLAARKELAAELNYTGPYADGSAEKNIWLHKAVMQTLAENGGKIPKELLG